MSSENYILGLDIGANSIGWCMTGLNDDKPDRFIKAGARVFEISIADKGDFAAGSYETLNTARRTARQQRRQLDRKRRRLNKIFRLLQKLDLLPPLEKDSAFLQSKKGLKAKQKRLLEFRKSEERKQILDKLDSGLLTAWNNVWKRENKTPEEINRLNQVLPYFLRARALQEKLSAHEFGRALFHLAQRRGYASNRKAATKADEELGKVESGIKDIEREMKDTNSATLGQYFAKHVNPTNPVEKRIRKRWTARGMYETEFDLIWKGQKNHHPAILMEENHKKIHKALFFQHPLKSMSHLIGRCELEPKCKRAPMWHPLFQRFRYLQKLNDLDILIAATGELIYFSPQKSSESSRDKALKMRTTLISRLENKASLTFAEMRKILKPFGITGKDKFNLELGGEDKIPGNRVNPKLAGVFGDRWFQFSETDKNKILEDLHSIQKTETLKKRGKKAWGLNEEQADAFSQLSLESDYCQFSKVALSKILPHLERGEPLQSILKDLYQKTSEPIDLLPLVSEHYPWLNNPIVLRVLSQLRRLVNRLTKKHGKPLLIRIELARDLRRSKKGRAEIQKEQKALQKEKANAIERILKECGIREPKGYDIEKVLLAEECCFQCPYTGSGFEMHDLFSGKVDVEHIIPFSLCLDNSFANKTLCLAEENRNVKKKRTPFEAYGNTDKWEQILQRVKTFKGNRRVEKLRRFLLQGEELQKYVQDFTERQLNDTRFATTVAADYLALLYGGRYDKSGKLRIQPSAGQITAYLRNEWGFNQILNDGGTKERKDHRHHAVDALVISLVGPSTIKLLSQAAKQADATGRRLFARMEPLWSGMKQEAEVLIKNRVITSHKLSHKVCGALHKDSLYSPKKKDSFRRIRKPLDELNKNDIDNIADKRIQELVRSALHNGKPKEVFKDAANHPKFKSKKGREIPIHKVRIKVKDAKDSMFSVSNRRHNQFVANESNHHMEILEIKDKKGNAKWIAEIVNQCEAQRRKSKGEAVIKKDHGPDKKFIFSLAGGDTIELDTKKGRILCRVRTIAKQLWICPINDARKKDDIKKTNDAEWPYVDGLRERNCKKLILDTLGQLHIAND